MGTSDKPRLRWRAVAPAFFFTIMLTALPSGCGTRAPAPVSATTSWQDLGTVHLTKATGRRITMAGGSTVRRGSPTFRLPPGGHFMYVWQCQGLGRGASFSASVSDPTGDETHLVDTTRGDPPVGDGMYVRGNRSSGGRVDGSYTVNVSARACRWSLSLIVGGRALATYRNPAYRFAISFDPTKVILVNIGRAVQDDSTALRLFLASHTSPGGYALALVVTHARAQATGQGPAAVEAMVAKLPGSEVNGPPAAVTLGRLQGYKVGWQHTAGSETRIGTAYCLWAGGWRYELETALNRSRSREPARSLDQLLRSLRFSGQSDAWAAPPSLRSWHAVGLRAARGRGSRPGHPYQRPHSVCIRAKGLLTDPVALDTPARRSVAYALRRPQRRSGRETRLGERPSRWTLTVRAVARYSARRDATPREAPGGEFSTHTHVGRRQPSLTKTSPSVGKTRRSCR